MLKCVWVCLLPCIVLCGCCFQGSRPAIKIKDLVITENSVKIHAEIFNSLSFPVWVCEDVSLYVPANEITEFCGDRLYICRKMSAYPDYVLFEEAMIGKYVYLEPGAAKDCLIDISLFDTFMSFYRCRESAPPMVLSLSDIRKIECSIGYIDSELCKKYLGLAELTNDDAEGIYDYELPFFVKEYHPDRVNPSVLYVPHFWPGLVDEKDISCVWEPGKR